MLRNMEVWLCCCSDCICLAAVCLLDVSRTLEGVKGSYILNP